MMIITTRQHIEESNPQAHHILQLVAQAAFERADLVVPLPLLNGINLQPALNDGLLSLNDDAVVFSNEEVLQAYTARYAADQVGLAWDDIATFSETFNNVERRGFKFGTRREFGVAVLVLLAVEDLRDIVGRMAEIAQRAIGDEQGRQAFWDLYPPFSKALPMLQVDVRDLAIASHHILQASTGDMMGGMLHNGVEEYASQLYSCADALYQALIANPESRAIELAVNALRGLGISDIHEAQRRALELTNLQVSKLRGVGILALGRLTYTEKDADTLLVTTLARLDELRSNADSADAIALAQAYGDLLSKTQTASSAIVKLAENPDPEVKHAVAWVVMRHSDKTEDKEWVKEALLHLAAVPSENKGTFRHLDHCAYDLLSSDLDGVLVFIEAVVISRSYRGRNAEDNITKVLETTFDTLSREHKNVLCTTITRWFASSDRRLHRAARDIIEERFVVDPEERAAPFLLDKSVLDSLDDQQVAYVVMHILGHGIFGSQSAALVLSAVQREPCSAELQQFVTDLLCDYVLYNTPGGAGKYLTQRADIVDASEVEKRVARSALDRTNAQQAARQALPALKELQPSSQRIYLVRLARQKQQATMMEQAEQHSVFLSLVHRAPLKYGRSFFFERDGAFSESTPLQAFEQSVELPRGELIDPIGQAYQRFVWQSIGVEDASSEVSIEDDLVDQGN